MMQASIALALTRHHESSAANTFRLVPDPPVFVRGDGCYLFNEAGEAYLDLVCGSATSNLGHGHPAHRKAIEEALASGILHTGTRLPSPFRAALYESLAAILPDELDCIQLANSGAEAVEIALKAAQFVTRRHRLVAFAGGYHGRTIGALSLTSGERIRRPFATLDHLVDVLPYPGHAELTAADCLAAAEGLLGRRKGEGELPALIIVEAVQAVSGIIGPDIDFLRGLQELAGRHDVLLALDEIWNGFGRTGRWFAFEHANLRPDLVIMGKALSGGLPLSAVAASPRLLKAWSAGMHTSTFQGNPLACAMSAAGIETIRTGDLIGHVERNIAPLLKAKLSKLQSLPGVAAVRVVGAQAAVQFQRPDGSPDPDRSALLQRRLLDQKILAYGGGTQGDCLMLVPAITIDPTTLETALATVGQAIAQTA